MSQLRLIYVFYTKSAKLSSVRDEEWGKQSERATPAVWEKVPLGKRLGEKDSFM